MSNDKHYNPAICQHLQRYVGQSDWQGLFSYLDGLSHSHFRTAGYILGEHILPQLDEAAAWTLARVLAEHDARAFLVTMTKAIALRLGRGEMHLRSNASRAFLAYIKGNDIDSQKAMATLLPVLESPDDIAWLFRKLDIEEGLPRLPLLLRVPTLAAGYVLFQTLHHLEHDRPMLVRVASFLMKRGDALGFNLASLLRTYYGLDEVLGTFALRIEPYQLARLNANYEAFCTAMMY